MPLPFVSPAVGFIIGVLGFALLGLALVHVSEGRRFREQSSARKRAIVCIAFAQWPYMVLVAVSGMALLRQ